MAKDPSTFDPVALVNARDRQPENEDQPFTEPNYVDPNAHLASTDPDTPDPDTEPNPEDSGEFDWTGVEDVPERLKGKTPAQIAREFASMQSEFGRQGTELGEARSLVREIVADRLKAAQPQQPQKKLTLEELEQDPDTNIRSIVADAVKEAMGGVNEQLHQQEMTNRQAQLRAMHPDYQEVVASPEFAAWVKESPYRIGAYNAASQGYNVDAAHELLSGFKELQAARKGDEARGQVRQRGAVTGGGGTRRATTGKIYSAEAIQHEYQTNRALYNSKEQEYAKAFAEGRVK